MKLHHLSKSLIFAAAISLSVSGFADYRRETEFETVGTPEGFLIREVYEDTRRGSGVLHSQKVVIEQNSIGANQKTGSWEITADDLPVTQEMCEKVDSSLCDANETGIYEGICRNKCIMYGPEVMAYDSQREKLYLTAHTMAGGNDGRPFLNFVANLKTYKIEFFNTFCGPLHTTLSPSGDHLLLMSPYVITTIDTNTRKELHADLLTWKREGEKYFYAVSDVKWLNDFEVSYVLLVLEDKFSRTPLKSFKQEFDLKKQKLISSKVYTDPKTEVK